jgi:hypothetical protein
MRHMTALVNIYEATRAWVSSRSWAEFSKLHTEDWKVVQNMIVLEKAYGKL